MASHRILLSLVSLIQQYVVLCARLCLTLYNPMDCGPPGSSVLGIFQAKILEYVEIHPYCYLTFHYIAVPQCIYSSSNTDEQSGSSQFSVIVNNAKIILAHTFWWTYILICLVYIPGSAWLQVCMCSVLDIQRDIRSLCGLLEKLHSVTTLYEKRMRRGHPLALVPWPPNGSLPPVYPGHHDLPQIPFTLSFPSILPNKDPSLNSTTLPGQYCIPYLSICWPWTGF